MKRKNQRLQNKKENSEIKIIIINSISPNVTLCLQVTWRFKKKIKQNYKGCFKNYIFCICSGMPQAKRMLTNTSLMPQLLWSFLPFPFQSFLFQFYPAAYKQIRFNKALFHHVSFLLRKLLTLNFSSHQVETSLQTFMALHNQIDPFYTASFKTVLSHEALHHKCGLPFTFPNYSTDSYFLVSTQSFPFFLTQQ